LIGEAFFRVVSRFHDECLVPEQELIEKNTREEGKSEDNIKRNFKKKTLRMIKEAKEASFD